MQNKSQNDTRANNRNNEPRKVANSHDDEKKRSETVMGERVDGFCSSNAARVGGPEPRVLPRALLEFLVT